MRHRAYKLTPAEMAKGNDGNEANDEKSSSTTPPPPPPSPPSDPGAVVSIKNDKNEEKYDPTKAFDETANKVKVDKILNAITNKIEIDNDGSVLYLDPPQIKGGSIVSLLKFILTDENEGVRVLTVLLI
jgi:hypothetical protein